MKDWMLLMNMTTFYVDDGVDYDDDIYDVDLRHDVLRETCG